MNDIDSHSRDPGSELDPSFEIPAFEIKGLSVAAGATPLVKDVSLSVAPGSIHCLVGDSGSGKTMTSLAAVGLLPAGIAAHGEIRLSHIEDNLLDFAPGAWSALRGNDIGYVGQNALGCLHPAYSVQFQLVEAIRRHQPISRSKAQSLALEQLAAVDLPDPRRVAKSVPPQLSGGMCQRVALAIALCNQPAVLIADEPTTALDDKTQEHILHLIEERTKADGLGVLLITHDQDIVRRVGHEVTSIHDGVSSSAPLPGQATKASRRSPGLPPGKGRPTLEIADVSKNFGSRSWRRDTSKAVLKHVSVSAGERMTIGLVGRSGAGKTTLAQIVAGILAPTSGEVLIGGRPITGAQRVGRVEKARLVQYVFQDPYGSLNPRRPVLTQAAEPLLATGTDRTEANNRARALLLDVGLSAEQIDRRPTELSGGQCQRVGIARALIVRPKVVVLDEPVSALDWSIRGEILNILDDLQAETGATYLLIAHERPLIEEQCDEIFEVIDGAVQRL